MPRYFFDVRDAGRTNRDESGIDLPDVGCVWQIAVTMVDEIAAARQHLPPPHSISVVVRDASDAVVYRSDHFGQLAEAETGERTGDRRTAATPK